MSENVANTSPVPVTIKMSAKRAVSVYGLQRMPITLYAGQWTVLLGGEVREKLLQFIADHKADLAWKEGQEP